MDLEQRRSELRRDLSEAQRRFVGLLERVGPEAWTRPVPGWSWTIRDLLTHVATAESGFNQVLRRMAAGEGGVPPDFDPNRWNAGQLRRHAEASIEQLRAELDSAHREMLTFLERLDEAALEQRGRMSTGEEGSVEDTLRLVARHKRGHSADLEAALG